jgi:hypothetical protein
MTATMARSGNQRRMASSARRAHAVTGRWRRPCCSDHALLGASALSTGKAQIRCANGTSTSTMALSQRRPRLVGLGMSARRLGS